MAAAAVVITALSPPFGKLLGKQQQLSGEYRALHSRVRSQCESIAFYGGHIKEASLVSQAFNSLTRHTAGEKGGRGTTGFGTWVRREGSDGSQAALGGVVVPACQSDVPLCFSVMVPVTLFPCASSFLADIWHLPYLCAAWRS